MDTKTTPPEGEPHRPHEPPAGGAKPRTGHKPPGPDGAGDFWAGSLGADAFEKLSEGHRRAVEQMTEVQQAMIARLQELQELELDYAGRLAACATPSEAIEVLTKWTAARMAAILDGQREMQRMVLDALAKAGDAGR